MTQIVDAAIIGAGVAGSSLAKGLAERGWDTLLLDSQSFPRHKVCGEFLSPEAYATLKALDLADQVEALRPSVIERIRLIFADGTEIEAALPGQAWGISRYALDERLHFAARQAGAQLRLGVTVTGVHKSVSGFHLDIKRHGAASTVKARIVIAAWGSKRRAGLADSGYGGVAKRGFELGSIWSKVGSQRSYMGVKSHITGMKMEPVVEMYFFRGGYLGLCPIENGVVNAAALLEKEEFAGEGKSVLDFIKAAASRNPKLRERLEETSFAAGTQAATAPIHLSRAPQVWGGWPQLGDAAAMIPPLCGDGMSMALRSAMICAPLADRYLRGELALTEWEKEYSGRIHSEFNGPLQWGRVLQWLFGMPAMSPFISAAAKAVPGAAQKMVQATRLKM